MEKMHQFTYKIRNENSDISIPYEYSYGIVHISIP